MNSFPSALNESKLMYGGGKYSNYKSSFDISKLKALNLTLSSPVMTELLKEKNINIANFNNYYGSITQDDNTNVFRENPLMLPYDIISLAKDYEWAYNVAAVFDLGRTEKDEGYYSGTAVAPSMFSPLMGVNVKGITSNVPLLNNSNYSDPYLASKKNLSTCTIRELCSLSKNPNSILGMATYKYADFMYCKDLGKVSNNHMITLRRFAHPVPDHIFEMTAPNYAAEEIGFMQEGDVGRLITWFDTDDNKLEDIIKFSFGSTWKELTSQIEEQNSTADDSTQGIIGLMSNTLSTGYARAMEQGQIGTNNMWSYIGKRSGLSNYFEQGIGKNNKAQLENYDNNRVYNPKNTIQETNLYEGKIVFNQEFTLNFSYKLRAYDNINPKSAFLDLIGNILEVCGRRGRFWGGQRKLIGPPHDTTMFKKTDAIINKTFDKIGGIWENLMSGTIDLKSMLGALAGMTGEAISGAKDMAKGWYNNIKDNLSKEIVIEQAKGLIKNALGRPTMIAWQSLLDGSDVGLWHVTIGNPKNPIMAMGNMIVTNSEITQYGPLGLDDFPTEIRVSITLKHGRPRDITDIGRMYTKGLTAIYQPLGPGKLDQYFDSFNSYGNSDANYTSKSIEESKAKVAARDKQTSTEQKTQAIDEQTKTIQDMATNQAQSSKLGDIIVGTTYIPKMTYGNSNLPNPFIDDGLSFRMSQMNNYSSIMAQLAADEIM